MQIAVSESALMKRINRVLARDDEKIRKARNTRVMLDYGEYYTVDTYTNFPIEVRVDLEDMGRELSVLRSWEHLEG